MCATQEVFCDVCAAQEIIMFRIGGLCDVYAAACLYLWATLQVYHVQRTKKQNHDPTGAISQHGMITRMHNTSQGIPEVL